MDINEKEIEHVATLVRIRLSDKEKEKMTREFGAILGYIDKLKEVDTEGIEPIVHPVKSPVKSSEAGSARRLFHRGAAERQFNGASITGMENVLRVDEPSKKPLEDQAADVVKLVEMVPDKKNNFVKVPAVFGE